MEVLKDLAGAEDLLLDAELPDIVVQSRGGNDYNITKINADTIPYTGTFGQSGMQSIKAKIEKLDYILDTIEDLATYTGTGLVIVKDIDRGGIFIYDDTQSAINNGGTVFDGWVRQYDGTVNVKWFGAKGDGLTDDTIAFQAAFDCSLYIYIPKTDHHYIVNEVTKSLDYSDKFNLYSNGAILKPRYTGSSTTVISVKSNTEDFMDFSSTVLDETSITIEGLNIDCINYPEIWDETHTGNLVIATALAISATSINLDNVTVINTYGYGIKMYGGKYINIRNTNFRDVGGKWYTNNAYDAFGDCLYFSRNKPDGVINITDCDLIAYDTSVGINRVNSRIGVTFEYSGAHVYNVYLTNVRSQFHNRGIHIEESSKIQLHLDNCDISADVDIFVYGISSTEDFIFINNSKLTTYGGNYSGSKGWIAAYNSTVRTLATNSLFRVAKENVNNLVSNTGYIKFYNCVLDYNNSNYIFSYGIILFDGCTLKNISFSGATVNYSFYSTTSSCVRCTIHSNYSTGEYPYFNAGGFNDCVFDNIVSPVNLYNYNVFPKNEMSNFASKNSIQGQVVNIESIKSNIFSKSGLSKILVVVKFSDGGVNRVIKESMFLSPSSYGAGYYYYVMKKKLDGTFELEGTINTKGNPGSAGFTGTSSDGLNWTASGAYSSVIQILTRPVTDVSYLV